jgi:hypothetical protein
MDTQTPTGPTIDSQCRRLDVTPTRTYTGTDTAPFWVLSFAVNRVQRGNDTIHFSGYVYADGNFDGTLRDVEIHFLDSDRDVLERRYIGDVGRSWSCINATVPNQTQYAVPVVGEFDVPDRYRSGGTINWVPLPGADPEDTSSPNVCDEFWNQAE